MILPLRVLGRLSVKRMSSGLIDRCCQVLFQFIVGGLAWMTVSRRTTPGLAGVTAASTTLGWAGGLDFHGASGARQQWRIAGEIGGASRFHSHRDSVGLLEAGVVAVNGAGMLQTV